MFLTPDCTDNRRMDEWVSLDQFDLNTVQLELVEEDAGGRSVLCTIHRPDQSQI